MPPKPSSASSSAFSRDDLAVAQISRGQIVLSAALQQQQQQQKQHNRRSPIANLDQLSDTIRYCDEALFDIRGMDDQSLPASPSSFWPLSDAVSWYEASLARDSSSFVPFFSSTTGCTTTATEAPPSLLDSIISSALEPFRVESTRSQQQRRRQIILEQSSTPSANNQVVQLTHSEIRTLLSLAFLAAVPENLAPPPPGKQHQQQQPQQQTRFDGTIQGDTLGFLSMRWLYTSKSQIASERLKCLLCYFASTATTAGKGVVTFTRTNTANAVRACHGDTPSTFCPQNPDAAIRDLVQNLLQPHRQQPGPISTLRNRPLLRRDQIDISSTVLMEAACADHDHHTSTTNDEQPPPSCGALVDFANESYGYGVIIPSATQEEVIFSVRPELYAAIGFMEMMRDDEAIVVNGARCYAKHSGYGDTFRCEGTTTSTTTPAADVIVVDAMIVSNGYASQFADVSVARDISKLLAGFSSVGGGGSAKSKISTGNWGCGVFGGDYALKFVEQVIVASIVGRDGLHYCTFGRETTETQLKRLADAILPPPERKDVNLNSSFIVGALLDCIRKFYAEANRGGIVDLEGGGGASSAFATWLRREMALRSGTDIAAHEAAEAKAFEEERQKRVKLCQGGCGWDLGASNPNAFCSSCQKKQ